MGHSFPVALPQCETGKGSPTVESCATVICLQESSFFVSKNRRRQVREKGRKQGEKLLCYIASLSNLKGKEGRGTGDSLYIHYTVDALLSFLPQVKLLQITYPILTLPHGLLQKSGA